MTHRNGLPSYVLVTPARNEEDYIEKTIRSVISQTVLPLKWVVVSDGSTDRTDEIVRKYLPRHPWMELVRMPERRERNFAGKATCFQAGYQKVRDLRFDVIGNLDADISFERDYFEYILDKFRGMPELGVAGTPFVEGTFQYDYNYVNIEHVSGPAQLFRRECFEEIGGYVPITGRGDRPRGRDDGKDERVENENVHGQEIRASQAHGDGKRVGAEGTVPVRKAGLLSRGPSPLGNLPMRQSNEAQALCSWWTVSDVGVSLGVSASGRETRSSGIRPVPKERTDGTIAR